MRKEVLLGSIMAVLLAVTVFYVSRPAKKTLRMFSISPGGEKQEIYLRISEGKR